MVPSSGEGMVEISSMVGNKASGMRNWFKEHLPFKMLNYIPNVDIDNPYNGLGLTMGWDSRYRRVFLTKKDYIPKNPCIQYIEGQGFVIDETLCNGEEPIKTCPEGYVLVGGECHLVTEGSDLCPDGYVYDPNLETCTLIETVAATCICTADVFPTPQTICSGGTTSIALTSTEPGISYTWTAVQSGVTGATSGTSNAIVQTLTGSGTVTYTIIPFETVSLCQGEPVQVVVTVKPTPNATATPATQTIESGNNFTINLTSDIVGTIFNWTVVNTGVTGPVNGSGDTITATITGAGNATYTITPTFDGCSGAPIQAVVTVAAAAITNTTEINIWFDNSGSMNGTLPPLATMRDTLLKDCIGPVYGYNPLVPGSDVLYNNRVRVFNMYDSTSQQLWNYNERFVQCLAELENFQRPTDNTVDQVINLTFADESDLYGYGGAGTFDNGVIAAPYASNIALLRAHKAAFPGLRGVAFRVATNNNYYSGFRALTEATFVNDGVYTPPSNISDFISDFGYVLDVTPGATVNGPSADYYLQLIRTALNNLGFNIAPC